MRRYPAYKPSSVDWLGEIPEHWDMRRLKYAAWIIPGQSPDESTYNFAGEGVILVNGPDEYSESDFGFTREIKWTTDPKKFAPANALLFCMRGSTTGRINVAHTDIAIGRGVSAIISKTDQNFMKYILLVLRTYVVEVASGSTFMSITSDELGNYFIAIPPLNEQDSIIAYLDRELADIQELLIVQEAFIEGLREKRTALISQLVTQGLNPDTTMRDSGIEWLGEVPAHWEVRRNKSLFFEVDHRSTSGEEELLTVSHLTGVTPRSEKNVNMFMAETLEDYKVCQAGDLVINTMWGWMGAMGFARQVGAISPSYNVYRPRNPDLLDPDYFDLLYRTPRHIAEIKRNSVGVWESRLRIYPEVFLSLFSPLPPVEEQAAIAAHIARATARIDRLIEECYQAVEILRERRTALITAAVTGQIDVRAVHSTQTHESF